MTPRTQALAFRIWQYCTPRGWDCTYAEIAEALNVDARAVGAIAQSRGWRNRLRVAARNMDYRGQMKTAHFGGFSDRALEDLEARA